jgi:hypothetical protein
VILAYARFLEERNMDTAALAEESLFVILLGTMERCKRKSHHFAPFCVFTQVFVDVRSSPPAALPGG